MEWSPQMATTQAELCDLLEQIVKIRDGDDLSIAVVITAWDTISDRALEPQDWLEWKLPLLWQWLRASEALRFETFGVSAQGGDLSDPQKRQELAALKRTERPGGFHRLLQPVEWLFTER